MLDLYLYGLFGGKTGPFGVVDGQLQRVGAPSAVISMCLPTLFVLTILVVVVCHDMRRLNFPFEGYTSGMIESEAAK
jgi:hypothetical protein